MTVLNNIHAFNIRVYGLLYEPAYGVLTSIEPIQNEIIRKFPGGGLELGESINDCIKREFLEELNLEVEIVKQIYITDFFVESAFKKGEQIISIYLQVKANSQDLSILKPVNQEITSIEWWALDELNSELFPLPIDKFLVSQIIRERLAQEF